MTKNSIHIQTYNSICGDLIIGSYDQQICMCDWLKEPHHSQVLHRLQRYLRVPFIKQTDEIITTAMLQLDEYFAGNRVIFDLPLLYVGTDFQQRVWRTLLTIDYGCTWSYKQLAIGLGKRTALRAVANAIGQNAISIIIPCHRIIGTDGSLTGYAGGLHAKQVLLELETAL